MRVRIGPSFVSITRRTFTALSGASLIAASAKNPWYETTFRWGQTNITERDPLRYDIEWWRRYWKETRVQGVIINAGGIVAYYPSRFPLHRRAKDLGDRDLFGDLVKAARADGLVVLARMDSSRASAEAYRAHPDWFACDAAGKPIPAAENFVTCINGPWYTAFLPGVLREIIERYHPDGFADNSWAGLDRTRICFCANCQAKFLRDENVALPTRADWNEPLYRRWIDWSYRTRLALWDSNNEVTGTAGGASCLWLGMIGGDVAGQARTFRDVREICRRSKIVLLDHQTRGATGGFHVNADAGLRLHGMLGWDKLLPESMPMYQMAGQHSFRLSARPPVEARMWMQSGFAGGIQPWWHHVGAVHEDRRAFDTAAPQMQWFERNEQHLTGRQPKADVAIVWSQRNVDFYGRDRADEATEQPVRGIVDALLRARIPYMFVHADDISSLRGPAALILPELAVMSPAQCAAVEAFAAAGGGVLATGRTSLFDEHGEQRSDYGLGRLLGVQSAGKVTPVEKAAAFQHSYLRIESPSTSALAEFSGTAILPFGGAVDPLRTLPGARVLATWIPPFPVFPPESSFMAVDRTETPAIVVNERQGRTAYLAADIDRRFAQEHLPDHGKLLAGLIRWVLAGRETLRVQGSGLCGVYPYVKNRELILHVLNWNFAEAWRGPAVESPTGGPLELSVRGLYRSAALLVASRRIPALRKNGWTSVQLDRIHEHEVIVLGDQEK